MAKKKTPEKKFLESDEMHQLDIGSYEHDNLKLKVTIAKQSKTILDLQSQVLATKSTIGSFKIKEAEDRVADKVKSQTAFKDSLKDKYKIDDGFGYSVFTGELIEGTSTTKE